MGVGKHIQDVLKLGRVTRYSTNYNHFPKPVDGHSFITAKISECLALWEIHKFHNSVDMGLLLRKAINHDLIEAITGDIGRNVKYMTPGMKAELNKVEKKAFDDYIKPNLPKSWQDEFESLILNPKTKDLEGKILDAADMLCTLHEAIQEISLGNPEFEEIFKMNLDVLIHSGLQSVDYYLKYPLKDYNIDLNQYASKEAASYIDCLHFDESVFGD